jgi:Grx4 family monothiol glutaredoxin
VYSDWPTFPQVYVNGEFIGGLDIIKEMNSTGELDTLLPKEEDLNDRLKKLINKARNMIFIKGTPEKPQCGFTRQLIQILTEKGIEFDFFNILEDDEVRQGLKVYSDWPTYPQVYQNGELLGGLDIIKEMIANNEYIN